jgi:hypothetical protein
MLYKIYMHFSQPRPSYDGAPKLDALLAEDKPELTIMEIYLDGYSLSGARTRVDALEKLVLGKPTTRQEQCAGVAFSFSAVMALHSFALSSYDRAVQNRVQDELLRAPDLLASGHICADVARKQVLARSKEALAHHPETHMLLGRLASVYQNQNGIDVSEQARQGFGTGLHLIDTAYAAIIAPEQRAFDTAFEAIVTNYE